MTDKTPPANKRPESSRRPSKRYSFPAPSPDTGPIYTAREPGRDILLRNLPLDADVILKRIAAERRMTLAGVVAEALREYDKKR